MRLTGTASCPEGGQGAEEAKAAGTETATTPEISMLTPVLFNCVRSSLQQLEIEKAARRTGVRKGGGGGWSEDSDRV